VLVIAGVLSFVIVISVSSLVYVIGGRLGVSEQILLTMASGLGYSSALAYLVLFLRKTKALKELFSWDNVVKRSLELSVTCITVILVGGYIMTQLLRVKYEFPEEIDPILMSPVLLALAPIVEELIFRGLVLKGLEHYVKEEGAMTISSLFFALVHYQALPLTFLFVMFLVGTLLAYSVVKWRTLIPSVIAHVAINAQALLLSQLF